MKIQKKIFANQQFFESISDCSIDAQQDKKCLFVRTTLNARFHGEIQSAQSIDEAELKEYFLLPSSVIGITGTNGKTTTASMIAHILMQNHYSVALLGTRGFFINGEQKRSKGLTTPTVLELYVLLEEARECDFFVMEVSSHAIVQNRIASLRFDAKILTNITSDHLDFHKTLEEYIEVKNKFFDNTSLQIINSDEPNARIMGEKITYGVRNRGNFYASEITILPFISAQIHSPYSSLGFNFAMCGLHNLYNALASIACIASLVPLSLVQILTSLENFKGVEGRMEIISSSPLIIVDFAHTHDGMEKILESFEDKKIVVVFGAGGDRDKGKRPKMGAIAEKYASKIYITSDNPRNENPLDIIQDIVRGIVKREKIVSCNPDRLQSIQEAIQNLADDEILFVLGKGDETYQIIHDKFIPFDDREVIRSVLESQKLSSSRK